MLIGLGADLMLENGLKMAFLDVISIFSDSQQPHLHILALDLACNQPLQGDLGDLPVYYGPRGMKKLKWVSF